jgi:hypothetical protein
MPINEVGAFLLTSSMPPEPNKKTLADLPRFESMG